MSDTVRQPLPWQDRTLYIVGIEKGNDEDPNGWTPLWADGMYEWVDGEPMTPFDWQEWFRRVLETGE